MTKMGYTIVVDIDLNSKYMLGAEELKICGRVKTYKAECIFVKSDRNNKKFNAGNSNKLCENIDVADEYWFFLSDQDEEFSSYSNEQLHYLSIILNLINYRKKKEGVQIVFFEILVGDYIELYKSLCKMLPVNYRQAVDWLNEEEQDDLFAASGNNIRAKVQTPNYNQSQPKQPSVAVTINNQNTMDNRNQGGDRITVNGDNNIVVNRSIVQHAFNKVKDEHDEETAKALLRIEEAINNSGNKEAVENFESFNEELAKPTPKKSILKTLWKGTLEALPELTKLIDMIEKIEKLFV